jgi:hypothetical protein
MHSELDLAQLEQGYLRSHLIFLLRQTMHDGFLEGAVAAEEEGECVIIGFVSLEESAMIVQELLTFDSRDEER